MSKELCGYVSAGWGQPTTGKYSRSEMLGVILPFLPYRHMLSNLTVQSRDSQQISGFGNGSLLLISFCLPEDTSEWPVEMLPSHFTEKSKSVMLHHLLQWPTEVICLHLEMHWEFLNGNYTSEKQLKLLSLSRPFPDYNYTYTGTSGKPTRFPC